MSYCLDNTLALNLTWKSIQSKKCILTLTMRAQNQAFSVNLRSYLKIQANQSRISGTQINGNHFQRMILVSNISKALLIYYI